MNKRMSEVRRVLPLVAMIGVIIYAVASTGTLMGALIRILLIIGGIVMFGTLIFAATEQVVRWINCR